LSGELNMVLDGKPVVCAGIEYTMVKMFAMRAGVASGSENDRSMVWTAGVGFMIRDYSLDYCYVPFGDLDVTHRISLGMKF
jgi:hypothetical protein